MRKKWTVSLLSLSAALAVAGSGLAPRADAAELSGQVRYESGAPATGVHVILEDSARGTSVGADGNFALRDLLPGDYTLLFEQIGVASQRIPVHVTAEPTSVASVVLHPSPIFNAEVAAYKTPKLEHLAQKASYLEALGRLRTKDRPNVVLILFDDMGWGDLGTYGNKLIKTPTMDKLSSEGVRLTSFYASSPVCTPSRAGLLTGRFPVRTGADHHVFFPEDSIQGRIRSALGWSNQVRTDEIFMPEMMKALGYETGMFGKWHLGDHDGARPNDLGFDHFFGILHSHNLTPRDLWSDRTIVTPEAKLNLGTLQERLTDESVKFIRSNRDRPFFLYLPYTAPHEPHFANPATAGRSKGGLYGDVIEDLDRQVARVMTELDKQGLRDKTLVIVTSDNGADTLGDAGPFRGYKIHTYEGGVRVPMIVRWPGHVPAGKVVDGMAGNLDVFPTLLAVNHAPAPTDRELDGADMLGLLTGRSGPPQDRLFYFDVWTGRVAAIRDEKYKYRTAQPEPFVDPYYPVQFRFEMIQPPMLTDMVDDRERLDLSVLYPQRAAKLRLELEAKQASIDHNLRGWR